MVSAIVSVLAGYALGLRFRLLTLIWTMAVGLSIIIGVESSLGAHLTRMALSGVVVIAGLQSGYLAGFVTRYLMRGRLRQPTAQPKSESGRSTKESVP